MVDQKIKIDVNETLELDYLIKQINNNNTIDVTSQPSENSYDLDYARKEYGIFNPTETGTFQLDINGQTIEIEVTDIPDSGVSRYKFDGDVTDAWGSNDGTDNTSVGYTSNAIRGQAKSFDGSDDYIETEKITPRLSGFTVAAWVNVDSFDSDGVITGDGDAISSPAERAHKLWADSGNTDFSFS